MSATLDDLDYRPVTGAQYVAENPTANVTAGLLRSWLHRGKIRAVGRTSLGEVVYDESSIGKYERERHAGSDACQTARTSV